MKAKHLQLVGDIICPGVDVDEWRVKNRAPLFPGKQNVWVFAYANDDFLTKNEITQRLYAAFEFWFESGIDIVASLEGRARTGDADNIRVTYIGETLPNFSIKIIKSKEKLETIPTIKSNKIIYVIVDFDYRGGNKDINWPIETVIGNNKVKYYCPNNSEWALQFVMEAKKDAAPERNDGDVISDLSKDAGDAISSIVGTPLLIAAGVISIVGIAYIVGKFK